MIREVEDVEEQLSQLARRDPTLTQGELVQELISEGCFLENENDQLKREVSYLQATVDALEMEKKQ